MQRKAEVVGELNFDTHLLVQQRLPVQLEEESKVTVTVTSTVCHRKTYKYKRTPSANFQIHILIPGLY